MHIISGHGKDNLINCKPKELLKMNLIHEIVKPQTCDQCNEMFENQRNLKMHILSKHEGKKVYKCSICKKFFFDTNKMKEHIVSVHEKDKKLLNCLPKELLRMNLFHVIEKSQYCETCGDKFDNKRELQGHTLSVHEGKNVYRCSLCKDFFTEIKNMKIHLVSVHGKDNLLTPKELLRMNLFFLMKKSGNHEMAMQIVKVNNEKVNLSNSVDKAKRLYKCEFCNSKFGIQKFLDAHLKKVHKNDNKEICGKSLTTTTNKAKKLAMVENENFAEHQLPHGWKKVGYRRSDNYTWDFYVYGPNGKKFRSNVEIRKYLERNPGVECDLDVTNISRPKNPQSLPSEELLKTNLATVHEEKQPYGWDICKKYFPMKSDLMNHIETEHVEKESIKESSEFEILDNFSEHKDACDCVLWAVRIFLL